MSSSNCCFLTGLQVSQEDKKVAWYSISLRIFQFVQIRPGALGRPSRIRWRGRWKGGSGWGIHVNPWLIHVNVWQKPLQYCKIISLQLIKINEKKRIFQFVVIHSIKGFGIVNKAEIDVFLEFSYFFDDPRDVGNLTSGSSAFSKSSLNIWKFMVHVLLQTGLENFEHYFTSVWDECNYAVVWSSLVAQLVKRLPTMWETWVQSLGWKDPLEKGKATHSSILGFPCGSAGKESAYSAGDLGSMPALRRTPGEGKGYPLQYSGLDNSMNYTFHGVPKSGTQLRDFHFHFEHSLGLEWKLTFSSSVATAEFSKFAGILSAALCNSIIF